MAAKQYFDNTQANEAISKFKLLSAYGGPGSIVHTAYGSIIVSCIEEWGFLKKILDIQKDAVDTGVKEKNIKDYVVKQANLVPDLTKADLAIIGNEVFDAWQTDKTSRADWESKTEVAMKLALQVMENKTFPWEGASNVKFPLVTIAALQYSARAYPALISTPEIVKCRVIGEDPDGVKQARANRISAHMSYQILEEDESWEDDSSDDMEDDMEDDSEDDDFESKIEDEDEDDGDLI